jgi:hypothetical protein
VLIEPPRRGSFEFLAPIVAAVTDPSSKVGATAFGLAVNLLYDLTKTTFSRLSGKPETPALDETREIARSKPGDLDAISDAVEEDIVRIQRPIMHNVININVWGGSRDLIKFDDATYEFARTRVVGDHEEEFVGHVTSFNGSTVQGRFWVDALERTVGFAVEKKLGKLPGDQRRLLAGSLNEWVNLRGGQLKLRGYPLTSRQGLLKQIFITSVHKG